MDARQFLAKGSITRVKLAWQASIMPMMHRICQFQAIFGHEMACFARAYFLSIIFNWRFPPRTYLHPYTRPRALASYDIAGLGHWQA